MKTVDHCPLCGSENVSARPATRCYEPILEDWIDRGYLVCGGCHAVVPVYMDGDGKPHPAWRNKRLSHLADEARSCAATLKRRSSDSPNGFVPSDIVEAQAAHIEELVDQMAEAMP